ncbi:MAG: glutamate racemase [Pacificimonas sp.]
MTTGPILIFDSGVGGLSVAAPIMAALPTAPIVYAADNAGFPYGSKSEAEIAARVPALLGRLVERYRPAIAVIACNTASTIALSHVRAALDLPVVGTVPAIKPAAERTKTGVIGVLGTPATVRQHYVDDLEAQFAAGCTVLRHGTADLATAAEAVLRGEEPPSDVFAAAMRGLLDQPEGERMDHVVLACTHFPLVEAQLAEAAGRDLKFLHGGDGIARQTVKRLGKPSWPDAPRHRFVLTEDTEGAASLRPALAERGFPGIEFL